MRTTKSIQKITALFIAFAMIWAITSPISESRQVKASTDPASSGLYTYTVHMAGYPGSSNPVWGLNDISNGGNGTPLDISFTQTNSVHWWTATFTHDSDHLSLSYTGGRDWRTPFNRSFVLTPEYNTVYIFLNGTSSILYPSFPDDGEVDFTVISWEEPIEIAGSFDMTGGAWTRNMAKIQPGSPILTTLTPVDADINPARQIHTLNLNHLEPGSHEFQIIRNNTWAGDLPAHGQGSSNASITIPGGPLTLTLNYYQFPQNLPNRPNDWNVWAWTLDAPAGSSELTPPYQFSAPNPSGWRQVIIELPDDTPKVGIIVRLGNWEQENPQIQVTLDTDANGPVSTTVWYIHGQNIYHQTSQPPYTGAGVLSALADWHNYIRITMNYIPNDFNTRNFELRDVTDTDWAGGTPISISGSISSSTGRGLGGNHIPIYHMNLPDNTLKPNRRYQIKYDNQDIYTDLVMRHILDNYTTIESLFHHYTPSGTTFKLWAPTAAQVDLITYGHYSVVQQGLDTAHFDANGRVRNSFLTSSGNIFPMTRNNSSGVWTVSAAGDLDGHFYMFRVKQPNGQEEYVVDPYATATSANGQLSAVQRRNPLRDSNGKNRLQREGLGVPIEGHHGALTTQVEHVIYEVHVRDFTIHESWGGNSSDAGKYTGFVQSNTRVPGTDVSTGLDHLAELGITTVHLLPISDSATINELGDLSYDADAAFNWGYDPQNYNVPEGSYSNDPRVPDQRIDELKFLIDELHKRGIRVVLDVVYNHTYSILEGPFHNVVPGYHYRTWCNGLFANGSGVGNEIASERPMVRQYIIESLLYWQEEFGVDGFRFDLMWLIDAETMYQAVEALRSVDPDVVIYGEPWQAATSPLEPGHSKASIPGHLHDDSNSRFTGITIDGVNQSTIGVHPSNHWAITRVSYLPDWNRDIGRFAFFNNISREIYMGHNDGSRAGFAGGGTTTQGSPSQVALEDAVRGITHSYGYSHWASDTLNYVSKHDNLVLWDKTNWSIGETWGGISTSPDTPIPNPSWHSNLRQGDEFINHQDFYHNPFSRVELPNPLAYNPLNQGRNRAVRSHTLAGALMTLSQGIPFIHAGDEFLRTKHGHRNTYRALDRYNSIKWNQKVLYKDVFEFYQGIIELRKHSPAFRMDLLMEVMDHYEQVATSDRLLAYRYKPHNGRNPGDGEWEYIYVAFNGYGEERTIPNFANSHDLNVIVTSEEAGIIPVEVLSAGEALVLPPFSAFVGYYDE